VKSQSTTVSASKSRDQASSNKPAAAASAVKKGRGKAAQRTPSSSFVSGSEDEEPVVVAKPAGKAVKANARTKTGHPAGVPPLNLDLEHKHDDGGGSHSDSEIDDHGLHKDKQKEAKKRAKKALAVGSSKPAHPDNEHGAGAQPHVEDSDEHDADGEAKPVPRGLSALKYDEHGQVQLSDAKLLVPGTWDHVKTRGILKLHGMCRMWMLHSRYVSVS